MKKLTACPVCQKTDMTTYTKCDDHMMCQETFTLTKCTTCGLIATNPRQLEKELEKYYEFEDYISHSETNKGLVNRWYHIIKRLNTNKKVTILGKEKGCVLEIGSGAGFLLNKCKERGWDTVGVEPNAKARENARASNNIELKESINEVEHKENAFDRVMMWHVLEHVADLDGLFSTINKVLKKDGKLIIAVPNSNANEIKRYKSHWAAYDVPGHLYHFQKSSIKSIANKYGFEIEKIKPMWFDSFYISMLSEKIKTGKNNYINAISTGLWSNLKALTINGEYSSLVYILTPKEPV